MTRVLWGPEQVWGEGWTGKGFLSPPEGQVWLLSPEKLTACSALLPLSTDGQPNPWGNITSSRGGGRGAAVSVSLLTGVPGCLCVRQGLAVGSGGDPGKGHRC